MKTKIFIEFPFIYSFKESLIQLDRGFNDCMYHLDEYHVSKLISLSSGIAFLSISSSSSNLIIEICKNHISTFDLDEVRSFIISWFDLDREILPFYNLLDNHPILNSFSKKYWGARIVGIPNLFEAICWCIIGQQINLTFAHRVKRNLVEVYGEKRVQNGHTYFLFPTPQTIRNISRESLASMKFSRQKINYLYNISDSFINNTISKSALLNLDNKDQRISKLLEIKGIGVWTANYVAMKCLGDMSCITYGDTGISHALHLHFKTDKKPTKDVINGIFGEFKSWESYLNIYLWRSLL